MRLHAPFAGIAGRGRGDAPGVGVVTFEIIHPCDALAPFGRRFGRESLRLIEQRFRARAVIRLDERAHFGGECSGRGVADPFLAAPRLRSEERGEGQELVNTCSTRWYAYH